MFARQINNTTNMNISKSIRLAVYALLLTLIPVNIFAYENERLFQFGFFPPISSNGMNSAKTINAISLNLIGGYSAGNKIFELGGFWNASKNYTKGIQISGLLNYSGNSNNTVQLGGLGNIAMSGRSPLQIGGLFNVAGLVNGVQLSGLINVAKKVKGLQVGLINYMEDGEDGVSIGLINVARHGGKYEFEVSFSEAVNTMFSFRLGTDRFYTIFSGGINYFLTPFEYVIGFGLGTNIDWRKNWSNQLEIHVLGISHEKEITNNSTNNIIQMRFPISKEFFKHFKLFVGPTFNIGLQGEEIVAGKKISSWVMWNSKWNNFNVSGWVGISGGIRF